MSGRPLGSAALLTTLALGLAAPGCFHVGDDDASAGQAGKGGSSGAAGSGGTAGSGAAATGGTGTGGKGASCVASGSACVNDEDCCAFTQTNGYCIDGTCTDGCKSDGDCATSCCAPLSNGDSACAPPKNCCVDDGADCVTDDDCCSALDGKGYCVLDTHTCTHTCKNNGDCTTGCCAALQNGDSACAPADFCK